jgi:hypothetical protein
MSAWYRTAIESFRSNDTDLRVMAFATPLVVSLEASKACASFITSVVNTTDLITK